MKIYCCIIALIIVLSGCDKDPAISGGGNNGGGPVIPDIPVPSSETVKSIFISSTERDANNFGIKALTVFDNSGNIRWKKIGRGNGTDGYTTYSNGLIFSSEPDMNGSNFYAYDINTGNDVWSKTLSSEYYYYPIVRNDTLFCSTKVNNASSGSIAAFNAKTGALYWRRQIGNPYWPINMVLDGSTLFYIIVTSNVDAKVVSFNINTQTVNWQSASLGINLASMFSNLSVSVNRVIVKTGTKLLMAFDRNNGATAWTVPGIPFDQPLVQNNTVFSICAHDSYYPAADSLYGLYAFDEISGSRKWKWKKSIDFNGGTPFISGNTIFISGLKSDAVNVNLTSFLNAFNLTTGNLQWSTTAGYESENICRDIVAVGNRVFAFKNSSGLPGSSARIVRYDFINGQAKDSIMLAGESFGKMFIVGSSDKVYTTR
jgi:outer membrane protein assembly factor BamB